MKTTKKDAVLLKKESEIEFEKNPLLQFSSDLICIAGMDGYFKYVNPAWSKLLGYSEEELLFRPFLDFIHTDDHHKTDSDVAKLSNGLETVDFENRYIHKDGSVRFISWKAVPDLSKNQMYCIGRDITERMNTENLLKQKTAELDQIFNTTAGWMRVIDLEYNVLLINESMAKMLKKDKNELIGKKCHDIFSGIHCNTPECPVRKMIKDRKSFETDTKKLLPDGNYVSCILNVTPFTDINGQIIGIMENFKDITERKQAEIKLAENEKRYIAAEELAIMGNVTVNLQDRKCPYFFSAGFYKLLGLNTGEKEMCPETYLEFVHPEDREKVSAVQQKSMNGEEGSVSEHRIIKKDGTLRWISTKILIIKDEHGEPSKMIGIMQDITALKLSEEAIILKNKVFDLSLAAQSISDAGGLLKEVNTSFLNIWGFSSINDVIGKPISSFFQHEYEAADILAALNQKGFWSGEYIAKRSDGTTFIAYSTATVILGDNGEIIGYQSSVIDITERKNDELNLQILQERLSLALKGSNTGLWDWNVETDEVIYDEQWCSMLGYKQNELKADFSTFDKLIHPEDKKNTVKELDKHFKDQKYNFSSEFRLKTKDGNWKWIIGRGKVSKRNIENKPLRMIGIHIDITERKLLEREALILNAAIEQVPVGIALADKNINLYFCNKEGLGMRGGIEEDLVHCTV